jgi:DNA-binding FrmR family transcriptional regulator
METRDVADRQFDALLDRLDRIAAQLEQIHARLEAQEGLVLISKELRSLDESLNALAYAALGQSPQVRRRRAG